MGSVASMQQPLIVAVCGDSGSGKTTLTAGMVQVFGQERVTHICLDDYHTLDRATRVRRRYAGMKRIEARARPRPARRPRRPRHSSSTSVRS